MNNVQTMREPVRRGIKYIFPPQRWLGRGAGGSGKEICARQSARDQNYYYRGGTAAVGVVRLHVYHENSVN